MRYRETDEVFKTLVSELTSTILPTTIMGLTILAIGLFAFDSLGGIEFVLATICGSLASLAKIVVTVAHRRMNAAKPATVEQAARWELAHALLTFVIAASVGVLATAAFAYDDLSVHILATAVIFGYSAGVAIRISVRPFIAAPAIMIAGIPTTVSAMLYGDTAHWILAAVCAAFLVAAMQSVWHVYATATRQICLRLEMQHQARHDPLTGLRNRTALGEAFRTLGSAEDALTCVHCFDLDGFKSVNDRFGHAVGDELLAGIGSRLRDNLEQPSIAVRVGGDEFAILQPDVRHPVEADLLARQIANVLSLPYRIAGEEITIGISLGYTLARSGSARLEQMMAVADKASYRAKRNGGGIECDLASPLEARTSSVAA
ncbi:GGDEF domain-containing protein [Hoeflea ulvae]|uniref:GGDEF domain-containing protein n=1 Tax=Hoeflea ulvae TaxID=2983764 RepID=A0ABT3YIN2_9HYPH|nr:GGDEF domain-containing protein [Hoeflea ulvae]MCY0095746.1 GGDEF domain-containing protein [Hoeflea ulvae]